MAFDGMVIYTLAEEMRDKLIPARVDKIYQPDPYLLTVNLRGQGTNYKLLISANPQFSRIHFTDEKFINPARPPAFCMLLRKYLSGGRVIEIKQPAFERMLVITVQNLNEHGDVVTYDLVVELMGRHSNIIITNQDGTILDAIRRIPSSINRHREVLPGREYIEPPAQDKANPLRAEEAPFKGLVKMEPKLKVFRSIMNNYRGISPLMGREIACRAGIDPKEKVKNLGDTEIEKLWEGFQRVFEKLTAGNSEPTLLKEESGKIKAYSWTRLTQYPGFEEINFPSMSQLMDYYSKNKVKDQKLDQISANLRKTITNLLKKDKKKQDKLVKQYRETKKADEYKKKGELITANIHQLKRGMEKFTTTDYYDPDMKQITIDLDPSIPPQDNAQKYFKKYNKLKNSVKYIKKELLHLEKEIDYLEDVELSLEQIESKADLEEIRQELIEEGYVKRKDDNRNKRKHRQQKESKPRRFKSSDGFDIRVGRNNKQNDKLTMRTASREDLWFHVKDIPGSHVVIRNHDDREVPAQTLEEAATLAAYYSKAKESRNVSVDYTQIKYVNKTKGAKPGRVIYDNYQTIIVNPDEKLIKKLRIE